MEKFTEEELKKINEVLRQKSLVSLVNDHLKNLTDEFVAESIVLKRKSDLGSSCDERTCNDGSKALEVCRIDGHCRCWCAEDDNKLNNRI